MLRRRVLPLWGAAPSYARQLSLHPVWLAVEASHAHASIRDRFGHGSARFVRSEGATQEARTRNGSETDEADDDSGLDEDPELNAHYRRENITWDANVFGGAGVLTFEGTRHYAVSNTRLGDGARVHDCFAITTAANASEMGGRCVGFFDCSAYSKCSLSSSGYAAGSGISSRLKTLLFTNGTTYGANDVASGRLPHDKRGMYLHFAGQTAAKAGGDFRYVFVVDVPKNLAISASTTKVELGNGGHVLIFDREFDIRKCLTVPQAHLLFASMDKSTRNQTDRTRITTINLYDEAGSSP